MIAAVRSAIEQANERLARVEQIKNFTIVPGDWLPGGDELTPTMKLKRRPIEAKYAAEIDAMYALAPDLIATDRLYTVAPSTAGGNSSNGLFGYV